MATELPFRWTSAAVSHVGLVLEMTENTCLEKPKWGILAVADGMGGHAQGELASRSAIAALSQLSTAVGLAEVCTLMRAQLQEVNPQL